MKKIYLKQLLTALLLMCCTAATAHDFEVDGIYYNITDATAKTVAVTDKEDSYDSYYNEYSGTVNIPATVTYNGKTYSVTSIGDEAFFYCRSLASIEIPNSVTSIGSLAFYNCRSLESINIPNSVTSIGSLAFSDCSSLATLIVDLNNNVYDSREDCNAIIETATNTLVAGCKNTIIPNSVTSIGEHAFRYCSSLESITIPNSVTSIGEDAFSGCSSLESVTIGNSVTSIGGEAFYNCSSLTSIEIPNSVTSIGHYAFYDCI